jgi:hypothetical protein
MVVGLFCVVLTITQLSLSTGMEMLATGAAGSLSLLALALMGRNDLGLLRNLLHPGSD